MVTPFIPKTIKIKDIEMCTQLDLSMFFVVYKKKIFFLHKKKIFFLHKKKIFFLYKKKISFLHKKKIFLKQGRAKRGRRF